MIHLYYILAVLSSCIYLFILLTHSFFTKCKRESTIIFQAPLQHRSNRRHNTTITVASPSNHDHHR